MRGFWAVEMRPTYQVEGIRQTVAHGLGLPVGSRRFVLTERLLRSLLPAHWVCHMVVAVAQKVEVCSRVEAGLR